MASVHVCVYLHPPPRGHLDTCPSLYTHKREEFSEGVYQKGTRVECCFSYPVFSSDWKACWQLIFLVFLGGSESRSFHFYCMCPGVSSVHCVHTVPSEAIRGHSPDPPLE